MVQAAHEFLSTMVFLVLRYKRNTAQHKHVPTLFNETLFSLKIMKVLSQELWIIIITKINSASKSDFYLVKLGVSRRTVQMLSAVFHEVQLHK